MTFPERLSLLGFSLATWCAGMATAAVTTDTPPAVAAPVMAAVGAGLFVTALLPGRTARFS